jgi:hypothetical protein
MINEKDIADYKDAGFEQPDPVNHPSHYLQHPSGVECIQITEHMGFTLGNAMKYLWRADYKNGVEDLQKAAWYINREIEKRVKKDNGSRKDPNAT